MTCRRIPGKGGAFAASDWRQTYTPGSSNLSLTLKLRERQEPDNNRDGTSNKGRNITMGNEIFSEVVAEAKKVAKHDKSRLGPLKSYVTKSR